MEQTLLAEAGELWNREAAERVWNDFQQARLSWSRPWPLYVFSRWAARHPH